MKTLAVDSSIRGDPALAEAVFRASNILDHELGRSADLVKAEWLLARDEQGRSRVVLRICDWIASAESSFAPEDLDSPDVTRGRILGLWGDLLQVRSRKLETQDSVRSLDAMSAWDDLLNAISDYSERHGTEPTRLQLPVRHAVALMKLGASHWGEFYQQIRRLGLRAFEDQPLLGMRVELMPGAYAALIVE